MTALAPTRPATMASVLELSDSFAGLWEEIATEFGIGLARASDPEIWRTAASPIRIVAAGGAETRAVAVLSEGVERLDGSVAVIGASPDHRLAMAVLRAGATEYFSLPQDLDALRSWLMERVDHVRLREQQLTFADREEAKYRFEGLIGTSGALRGAISVAARVIPRPSITVLITGETGTGKELLARAIHYNGPRRTAPFVDVNCAAIPEQLLESELFGHEKGAFTHATAAKPGLFEVANGGTIFLDEIGHLPLALQGKLLRALEMRTIRRLGGISSLAVDVRVIAATHVHLPEAVRRGEFREDLYYRLNVLPIELPPLRSREGDVLQLARHFLARFAADYNIDCPPLSRLAEARLRDHAWPGNIRELRNVIERSLLLHREGEIGPDDLAFRPQGAGRPVTEVAVTGTLRDLVRAAARSMVEQCRGNKSEAARRLAISRTRLLRLLDPKAAADFSEEDDE